MDLLFELIIVYGVYYLFDFGLAISARGISQEFTHVNIVPLSRILPLYCHSNGHCLPW